MVLMPRYDTGIGLHVKPHLCVRPSRTRPRATAHRCSGLTRWANFLPRITERGEAAIKAQTKASALRPFGYFKFVDDDLTALTKRAVPSFTPLDEN